MPIHMHVLESAWEVEESMRQHGKSTLQRLGDLGLLNEHLLAVHMFGGLRLMAMEWLPWTPPQKTLAAGATAVSFLVAGLFLLEAV